MSCALPPAKFPVWTGALQTAVVPSRHWIIWSEEHHAWRASAGCGYTESIRLAGRYSELDAQEITDDANRYLPTGIFNEVAMPDPVPGKETP